MKISRVHIPALLTLALLASLSSQSVIAQEADAQGQVARARRILMVNGVERKALVSLPKTETKIPAPLVFVYHGHGGNARSTARKFGLHKIWPEAVVVYPQGLKTVGRLTDPKGEKTGWLTRIVDDKNRDLDFFDALLKTLSEERKIDPRRIHVTGHSNGGGFTYFLWAERGAKIASFAPSASASWRTIRQATLIPRPVLHIGSTKDSLVLWEWQKATIDALRKRQECKDGEPWGKRKGCTVYPAKAPVYTFIHGGGHQFSKQAPAHMVAFFKAHPLAEKPGKLPKDKTGKKDR